MSAGARRRSSDAHAATLMSDDTDNDEFASGVNVVALTGDAHHNGALSTDLEELHERVNRTYGVFGERALVDDEAALPRRVSADGDGKRSAWVIATVFFASAFLSFVSHPVWSGRGQWANAFRVDTVFVVVWGPLLYWALAKDKLSRSLRTYLVLALFIESFSEAMFLEKGEGGYWDSVLWPASVAYFGTIKEFSGLPGASLPVFFFATLGLLWRTIWGKKAPYRAPPPRFARNSLLLFLATVVGLSLMGIAGGGRVDSTFRQVVYMLELPLVGLLFLYALRVPEDLAAVGMAFVLAAVARSLLVLYVYVGVCIPNGITEIPGKPEWCTTHSDTVLFVSAIVILLCYGLHERKRKAIGRCVALGLVIFLGIVLNNRRLAFVSLVVAPLVVYLALNPSKRKRRVTISLAVLVPLLVGYVLVGAESSSSSPLFKPAKSIISVLDQKDTSSLSRDIENENLIYTLRQSPVLSHGFGHEYAFSPNNPPVDLSEVFASYRLIAHNGVLWLWSIGGVVGFTLLWFLYPLGGTLALRGYRAAETPIERTAALAALGSIAVCVVQIWGDQGLISYMTLVTFGVSFAVASRLAVRAP
ncbi:MAG TPA: O-antigen ligase family protein [Labilithrix sp.]|nr:O-antigen ligase family protein [Labilithrix sp.]